MIAEKFGFQFEDFVIIKSSLDFTEPKGDPASVIVTEITRNYEIDFDFAFRRAEGLMHIFVKVAINQGQKNLPGYRIFAEGVGVIQEAQINIVDNPHLKGWDQTALTYCITQLRSYISTLTAYGPFGKYTLPLLDFNKIIELKKAARAAKLKNNLSEPTAGNVKKSTKKIKRVGKK